MRNTNRQERVTFSYDPLLALPELLGHVAQPRPATADLHGMWMNGGNRVTVFAKNDTLAAYQVLIYRQATPEAEWVLNATLNVPAGTSVTQQYDLGGYAVRGALFTNSPLAFDLEASAVIQSLDS